MSSNSPQVVPSSTLLRCAISLIAVLTLSSCFRDSAFSGVAKKDTVEGYREFLSEHPDDEAAETASERLSQLEFQEATRLHTVLAYKRFLEEFPSSSKVHAAQALLEGLRFNSASQQNSATAYRQFLKDHPEGAHHQEAERLLTEAEFKEVSTLSDPRALSQIIAENPDDPRRADAEARLDEESFAAAITKGAGKLLAYLREFPAGAHREQAKARLLSLELDGLLFSGLIETARERASHSPLAKLLPDLEARFLKAQRDRTISQAKDPIAQSAQADNYLRSLADLERSLGAPDPLDRWQAAEELGQHVTVKAIDPLLNAFRTSRSPLVRQKAFDSLGAVLRALPRPVAEYEVASRLETLRANASDGQVFLTIAALLDLSGQLELAASEYQRAFDPQAPDPVVLRRWAQIRRERRQFFSAAVAARQLSLWSLEVAREQETIPPGAALASARQLCAASQASRYASEVITEARKEKTEFPEDLSEFATRAHEAVKLSGARLADAELLLKTQDPNARTCDDQQVTERLSEGERTRSEVLRSVSVRLPKLSSALIELARERDPSPRVRAEAARLAAAPR